MKVVILAGGYGSRLEELTSTIPKPMVQIGSYPILHHIMGIYEAFGYNEFIIALGYKGQMIKDYFLHYDLINSDVLVDFSANQVITHACKKPNWKVHLVDTGLDTQTGGRVRRLKSWIGHEPFMLTYGDGLADVNITKLVEFHKSHGKIATVTAVKPQSRFGNLTLSDTRVKGFAEKSRPTAGWINGGFFVFEPEIFDYLSDDAMPLEKYPLEQLTKEGELQAFKHDGFWQSMDTIREVSYLRDLWNKETVPWLIEGSNAKKEEVLQSGFYTS